METKYLQVPNEEQRENARKEFNATAESVKRDVQALMEWLEKQPHLPNFKDEDVLSFCLLNCKNSLENTKHKFEMFFNTKASLPEIFRNRKPFDKELETQKDIAIVTIRVTNAMQKLMKKTRPIIRGTHVDTKNRMFVPLPKQTPDGHRVMMLYLSEEFKTTHYPTMDIYFKLNQMTLDLIAKLDYPKGLIIFIDAANVGMPTIATVSTHLPKSALLAQKAIPIRFKKFYFFNMGQASGILLTISKSLMKRKLADRMEILKNSSDICKYLPKEIIPREYGGEELPLKTLKDLWFEEIKNYNEFLLSMEQYSTDLSKVPKDSGSTELSGMVGSFRQISVD